LVDGLVIKEEDYKLVKTRFSAFFATHLHSVLQAAAIHNLVITGQCNKLNVNASFIIESLTSISDKVGLNNVNLEYINRYISHFIKLNSLFNILSEL